VTVHLARRRTGRLSTAEREEAIQKIYVAMVEEGEFRNYKFAELTGISTRRVGKFIDAARARIATESGEPPAGTRIKLAGRLDALYREAISGYRIALEKKDMKAANGFLATAVAAIGTHGKICGVESLPVVEGASVRFTLEATGVPPAVLERLTRIHGQSGPKQVLGVEREIPSLSDGREMREDDSAVVRVDSDGDRPAENP
jgi:hypothetical protein